MQTQFFRCVALCHYFTSLFKEISKDFCIWVLTWTRSYQTHSHLKQLPYLGLNHQGWKSKSLFSWHESMLLLGSKAAATLDSMDEDDPNFPFTSSAAMEQPVLLLNPQLLSTMSEGTGRWWSQSNYTLHFGIVQQQGHQPVEECQSITCVWFGSQGVRTCQHRIIPRTLGSQSNTELWEGNLTKNFPESCYLLCGNNTVGKQLLDCVPGTVRAVQCPGLGSGFLLPVKFQAPVQVSPA